MYCTIEDLAAQVSEQILIDRTDDEGTAPDSLAEAGPKIVSRLEKAITDAVNEINGYCQARYPIPFSPVPGFISKVCVDIALYNLFSRRGMDEETADKSIVDRYKAAVKNLENIAKGLVTLGAAAPAQTTSEPTIITGPPRIFSRKTMGGF